MILSRNCQLQNSKGRNSKNTYSRVMVLAICMSSSVLNICMKFYEYILDSSKVIEQKRFCQETAT